MIIDIMTEENKVVFEIQCDNSFEREILTLAIMGLLSHFEEMYWRYKKHLEQNLKKRLEEENIDE